MLDRLAVEAARRLGLAADVAARLRQRVGETPDPVLSTAQEDQQDYSSARATYLWIRDRGFGEVAPRTLAWAGMLLAMGYLLVGPFLFTWWIGSSLRLNVALRVAVLIVPAGMWLVALQRLRWRQLNRFLSPRRWRLVPIMVVLCLGGYMWQATAWFGLESGVQVALGASALAAAVFVAAPLAPGFNDSEADAKQTAQAAFDRWLDSLYERGVLAAAAEVANSSGTVYSTKLELPARSYVDFDTVVDIDTPATTDLRELLKRGKGSVALAGPRGAGKTTLLERWCAGVYLPTPARGLLSVRVDAPVGYDPKEFLIHLFGRLCDEVERLPRRSPSQLEHEVKLAESAREKRAKIRYLQSRTTEGELGFDVSWGAKIAAKRKVAVKRDDIPLNYPELVDEFRGFLREVAAVIAKSRGRVLIGVDELDRISDGPQAQKFINELKAVFDVPHCFFLVSVSEDALAEFELAAMGMRTAFDSAFDAVVRVDYLQFAEARRLLNLRVVNLPEQFAALAYALSGGLARELVRIVEVIGSRGGELPQVTEFLVRAQLRRTTRAAMDRLVRLPDRAAGSKLVPVLDENPTNGLRAFAARIEATELSEAARDTKLDVVVMCEYLAMLMDVFDHRLDEQHMRIGLTHGPGDFENLARVRRYLGVNPYAARELLAAFEEAWRIPG
ncbi:hypothetical protein [Lentzea sp. NPDC003310]|uniref:hypothetical protein n=1 Tax=Lentzea sp. NPDC003310 TaxID=3154447 RepID=UPI0033A1B890